MGFYCFAHVGRSLGQSVDQVLLAQYLLTPFFDTYQTWYSNGSGKHIFPFEFHITWSKVKVTCYCQDQTSIHSKFCFEFSVY